MTTRAPKIDLITTRGPKDYSLLDSGHGRKLERFGAVVVDRPEPQALWSPLAPPVEWRKAHAVFSASGEDEEKGRWRADRPVPEHWPVVIGEAAQGTGGGSGAHTRVSVLCRLSAMWHLGLFPEQLPHWQWMLERIAAVRHEPPRVLNLFGYTGAASLLAAGAGAHVTHVDASKKSVQWGKENQAASALSGVPIRWLIDDARKFAAREVRRGKKYHVVLVDPPKFGRGPEGEIWDLFKDLPALLKDCAALLDKRQSALVLTIYAIRASTLAFEQLSRETLAGCGGRFSCGELAIEETTGRGLVPTSHFTRWASHA